MLPLGRAPERSADMLVRFGRGQQSRGHTRAGRLLFQLLDTIQAGKIGREDLIQRLHRILRRNRQIVDRKLKANIWSPQAPGLNSGLHGLGRLRCGNSVFFGARRHANHQSDEEISNNLHGSGSDENVRTSRLQPVRKLSRSMMRRAGGFLDICSYEHYYKHRMIPRKTHTLARSGVRHGSGIISTGYDQEHDTFVPGWRFPSPTHPLALASYLELNPRNAV